MSDQAEMRQDPNRSKHAWWIATVFQLTGVFALATRSLDPQTCYIIMLLGAGAGMLASFVDRNRALIMLNGGYALANIIGIIQW